MSQPATVTDLLQRANDRAPDRLVADVADALAPAGATHVALYVVDYAQETLQPIGEPVGPVGGPAPVRIEGSMAGRSFQTQKVVAAETSEGWRVWAPIRERAEQIGVLEVGFARRDEASSELCEDLGRLIGHLVRTANRYTDLIEMRRRRGDMSLAAEVQWDMLLPPLAFRCPGLAIAAKLEPAYEVGGDAFDYAVNGDTFSFAFLDAMGHSLRSSLGSAVVLAGYRHGRRRGLDLPTTACRIDESVQAEFDGELFVTGHIGQLDLPTGRLEWVNAGHPGPLVARGAHVVAQPTVEPCLPLGLGITDPVVGEYHLEPGDRILYYSDGVVEARPSGGQQFGVERLVTLFERHLGDGLLAAEVLRRVVVEVFGHRADALQDDASLMLIEWPGPE